MIIMIPIVIIISLSKTWRSGGTRRAELGGGWNIYMYTYIYIYIHCEYIYIYIYMYMYIYILHIDKF